jgi:hypothetical protein
LTEGSDSSISGDKDSLIKHNNQLVEGRDIAIGTSSRHSDDDKNALILNEMMETFF